MPNLQKDANLKLPVKSNLQEQYDLASPDTQAQIRKLTRDIEAKLGDWTLGVCDTTDLEWRKADRKGGKFTVVLGSISGKPVGIFPTDETTQQSARVSQLYPFVSGGNPFQQEEYDFPKY